MIISEYMVVLLAVLAVPLVLSYDRKVAIRGNLLPLLKVLAAVCIPYWLWDVLATERGHWSFNDAYVYDVRVLGMPLEEWLFFPVIVFVSVFTWESTKYFILRRKQ